MTTRTFDLHAYFNARRALVDDALARALRPVGRPDTLLDHEFGVVEQVVSPLQIHGWRRAEPARNAGGRHHALRCDDVETGQRLQREAVGVGQR